MTMQFLSYKINQKHRKKNPTETASMWTVSEWVEIQLFSEAKRQDWRTDGKSLLWSIYAPEAGLEKIGVDPSNELYIAKFVCDNNQEWHGYPVHPRAADMPPEGVLEKWRLAKIIDKTDKRRIQKGTFRK